jgi:hypothetical protein
VFDCSLPGEVRNDVDPSEKKGRELTQDQKQRILDLKKRAKLSGGILVTEIPFTWQLHCYLLSRAGANKLLSLAHLPIVAPVDIHVGTLLQKGALKGYISLPQLALQSHEWFELEDVQSNALTRVDNRQKALHQYDD